jgi:DNA-directed RNA polymerase II subunit RPB2
MDNGTFDLYKTNLETTPYGKVFQKIIAKDGFSKNIIENYDNEILINMKKIIEDTPIEIKGAKIHFRNVSFVKPKIPSSSKNLDLIPKIAREKQIPYFSDIYADVVYSPNQEPLAYIDGVPIYGSSASEDIVLNQHIGSIPVMLGSKLCHLSDKTDEEKLQMGECFNDPLGYFFIKTERVITNQDNLRFSTFLIYSLNKDTKCSTRGVITCPTKQGTKITNIVICKHSTLSLILSHIKINHEPLNIFAAYRILGMKMKDAIKQILSFIDDKNHMKVKNKLAPSIAAYEIISEDDEDIEVLKNRILEIRKSKSSLTSNLNLDRVVSDIEDDLLSNIEGKEKKLLHLSMYTARMLEYMIGERRLDDRDNFGNKRIATPGRSLFFLFKGIWLGMNGVVDTIRYKANDIGVKSARQVANLLKPADVKNQLQKAFGPNAWGVKKSYRKENITESLKRDTPLAVYSQIGRVNTPGSRQSKNPAVRMPHPSQYGFCCLYESPEGEGLGLVKNLATTCYISLEREPESIINIIKNDTNLNGVVFINRENKDLLPLLVNGIIEGWCVPESTVNILKSYKSQGFIEKDVCIFYNVRDKCVEVFCDGGRPTRPAFVVNEECELLIDKYDMWNAEVDDLIKYNCIEYIDAREQEWLFLSDSIEKVRNRKRLLEEKEKYKNNTEKLNEIEIELEDTIEYTHCDIDPTSMFSISCNLIPQAHRQAGPRTAFQSGMGRQALTQYHSNEHIRFDTSYKMVHYPTKPLFQTDIQETSGLNAMSNGQLLQVAIMAHPDNAEDGIVFKEEAIKYANKLDNAKKFVYDSDIKNGGGDFIERFARPPVIPGEHEGKYSAIDEKGIPILDAFIREKDCVIGKVKEFIKPVGTYNPGDIVNVSTLTNIGEYGYIDRVLITTTAEHRAMILVKVRQNRKYIPGDKLACLSKDHLVMTKDHGWVFINDIRIYDEIATLNKNHEIEYHKPTTIHNYSSDGEVLYNIENENVSMCITKNHRMYCSVDGIKWELKEAKDMYEIPEFYIINENKELLTVRKEDFKEVSNIKSVHCLTIENETFLVKHNDKTHWTGNSRYSQKGTISRVIPAREMPRVASGPLKGMVPDILINPHSQPSRMTMNMIIEMLTNKAACINGKFYNATTFRNYEKEMEEIQQTLSDYGLDPNGYDYFEFPNGKPLKSRIYFGPCFYQALRHHVNDKIQMRARAAVKPSTRQPVSGRQHEGGLKVGEMERDALISHGSSALLRERLMEVSDKYELPICSTCGNIAIIKNDGSANPNECRLCKDKAKFGIITIPYVFKLLVFYLQAAGINITFKTTEITYPNNRPIEEQFLV